MSCIFRHGFDCLRGKNFGVGGVASGDAWSAGGKRRVGVGLRCMVGERVQFPGIGVGRAHRGEG